jgi:DNA repair protein RecO (recombination protein O)
VLHTYPWRETSLVLEVFTRQHGRVALVARGARRPHSALRGLTQAFTPLLLSWSGKAELRTLHSAEWQGGLLPPAGEALLCGFYLNELLLKLTAREDPHEALYDAYREALATLAGVSGKAALEGLLRRFELTLLREIGYAGHLDVTADGEPLDPAARYCYDVQQGVLPGDGEHSVCGQTLLDLAVSEFSRAATRQEAKRLMRRILGHHLGAHTLHTRQLLKELTEK